QELTQDVARGLVVVDDEDAPAAPVGRQIVQGRHQPATLDRLDHVGIGTQSVPLVRIVHGRRDQDRDVPRGVTGLELGQELPRVLAPQQNVEDDGARRDLSQQVTRLLHRRRVEHLIARAAQERLVDEQILGAVLEDQDRKSTRLNSSHVSISYAVFCLKKKKRK